MTAVAGIGLALGVVSALAALNSLLGSARLLLSARRPASPPRKASGERPEVTLVVPCCGEEAGLEANLDALLGQDYPRYHARFVVEGSGDGAVPVIERARERRPGRSELVVAGPSRGRGQKVHNLSAALESGPTAEVLAFADSDGRPDPAWLQRLVAELERPEVGVASSYRFYRPVPPGLATLLRSVWNLSVLALLGDHDRNFAWGGSMAIRREVFARARVAEAWQGTLSDDYALTHAVRRAGLRVAFVPECLVGSEGPAGLAVVGAFVARQIGITRVYWPVLFRLAALSSLSSASFLVLAPFLPGPLPLALLAAILAMGAAGGALRAVALGRLAPQWRPEVRRYLWAYALLAPLSGLLTAFGVLRAFASRCIEWRGRRYFMRSPRETVVLER